MFRWMFIVSVCLFPTIVHANDPRTDVREGEPRSTQCWLYHSQRLQCIQTWGCVYDSYRRRCLPAGDPMPVFNCEIHSGNRWMCQRQGCFYDSQSGRCLDPGTSARYICEARDQRWEIHASGHHGIGPDVYGASQQALAQCQLFHPACYVTGCKIY